MLGLRICSKKGVHELEGRLKSGPESDMGVLKDWGGPILGHFMTDPIILGSYWVPLTFRNSHVLKPRKYFKSHGLCLFCKRELAPQSPEPRASSMLSRKSAAMHRQPGGCFQKFGGPFMWVSW